MTAPGLSQRWQALVQADPRAAAIDAVTVQLSRHDFEALVQREQAALAAAGIGRRDIVAWLGLNSPRMLATLFACECLGAVLLPLNWRLATAELAAIVAHAGVAAIHGTDDLAPARDALGAAWAAQGSPVRAAADPGDLLLVYTSGTTGTPKGAMHTAAAMSANADAAIAAQGLDARTRCLSVLPLFHVGGLCIQTLPTLLAGGVLRLHARFESGAWIDDVARWRPTTSLLVPATMRSIIDHPAWPQADLSALHFVNSGSSVVPVPLIEAFHARAVPVAQVYGSTETGPVSIALLPSEAMAHPGKVGRTAAGVQVRLVDAQGQAVPEGAVGEILVRGANLMRGYHRAPAHPSFVDGWFHSGDLARRGADGLYEIVGRSKDMIISGGENIYPAEIENLVVGLPGVAECAVIGVPDPRWGEVPVLVVVPLPGHRFETADVRQCCEARLARFKHPRRIVVLESLPKTALGKIRKAALADAVRDLS
jgi:fatty-acyl-CoA synthase